MKISASSSVKRDKKIKVWNISLLFPAFCFVLHFEESKPALVVNVIQQDYWDVPEAYALENKDQASGSNGDNQNYQIRNVRDELAMQNLGAEDKDDCEVNSAAARQALKEAVSLTKSSDQVPLTSNKIGNVEARGGYLAGMNSLSFMSPIHVTCNDDEILIRTILAISFSSAAIHRMVSIMESERNFQLSAEDIELNMTALIGRSGVSCPAVQITQMQMTNMKRFQSGKDEPNTSNTFRRYYLKGLHKKVFENILESVLKQIMEKNLQTIIALPWYKTKFITSVKSNPMQIYRFGYGVAGLLGFGGVNAGIGSAIEHSLGKWGRSEIHNGQRGDLRSGIQDIRGDLKLENHGHWKPGIESSDGVRSDCEERHNCGKRVHIMLRHGRSSISDDNGNEKEIIAVDGHGEKLGLDTYYGKLGIGEYIILDGESNLGAGSEDHEETGTGGKTGHEIKIDCAMRHKCGKNVHQTTALETDIYDYDETSTGIDADAGYGEDFGRGSRFHKKPGARGHHGHWRGFICKLLGNCRN